MWKSGSKDNGILWKSLNLHNKSVKKCTKGIWKVYKKYTKKVLKSVYQRVGKVYTKILKKCIVKSLKSA